MTTRRLPNFIEGFKEYASTYNTAPHFTSWGALWMLGTAPVRAVAMKARGNTLTPNLYVLLIAGPGTGKSQLVNAVKSIMNKATGMSYIPPSVTRAGLEDYMRGNQKTRTMPDGQRAPINECIGLAEEMQGILPDQDLGHLTLYNLLYDLPNVHTAVTRSNGELRLEMPYASLLVGAQPAFLATTMPEQAWGMGFMSRSIMIFDTQQVRRSAFEFRDVDHKLKADLIHDLKQIHNLHGFFEWEPKARALYEDWWVEHGGMPVPQAKRLGMGYNSRRELHMLKLAMIYSLARTNDLMVTLADVRDAITALLHAEDRMKHIFNEMAQTGSMVAIQDVLDVVRADAAAGSTVAEARLIELLMQRFPSTQVHAVIDNLIKSGSLKIAGGIDVRGMRKLTIGDKMGGGL